MTPEQIAETYADAWADAFNRSFSSATQARIAELEYTDATAVEARRYMAELFNWAAAIGKHHPTAQRQQPTTNLHPIYRAMVEELNAGGLLKPRSSSLHRSHLLLLTALTHVD